MKTGNYIHLGNVQCVPQNLSLCVQVYRLLRQQGHNIVAVFTVPDDPQTGRPDPLAEEATRDGMPVLKYSRWRQKKVVIPEVSGSLVLACCPSLLSSLTIFTLSFSLSSHPLHFTSSPQILEEYQSFKPDLNVLPFCTQFIPMDVINYPQQGSIIYHPSLLPKHRGASAINWYVDL